MIFLPDMACFVGRDEGKFLFVQSARHINFHPETSVYKWRSAAVEFEDVIPKPHRKLRPPPDFQVLTETPEHKNQQPCKPYSAEDDGKARVLHQILQYCHNRQMYRFRYSFSADVPDRIRQIRKKRRIPENSVRIGCP